MRNKERHYFAFKHLFGVAKYRSALCVRAAECIGDGAGYNPRFTWTQRTANPKRFTVHAKLFPPILVCLCIAFQGSSVLHECVCRYIVQNQ